MRIVATIEARMRSSRLPGKVLKPIMGKPMLALTIERLQRVPEIDVIVIATTTDKSCDPIVNLAQTLEIECYRGSETDVLDRVLRAAHHTQADLIVETTGDCPLIDPSIVSQVIHGFLSQDVDYCSNILERTYPRGMDVQVFPRTVLEKVASLTDDPVDREHVSNYIYEHPQIFRLLNISSGLSSGLANLRLTVDTPEDFKVVEQIFTALYPTKSDFNLEDILALYKQQPELMAINQHVQQKVLR